MKLAHGIYHSRRRHQIRAVWKGQPFAKADERDVLKRDGSQSEGEFRHYLGSLLVSFGVPAEIAFPFVVSKIKNLSSAYSGDCYLTYSGRRRPRKNNRKRRQALWNFLFGSVFDNGVCYWCEKVITFDESTFDHHPPLSKGGNSERGVISCKKCNYSHVGLKHSSIPDYLCEMNREKHREHEERFKPWSTEEKRSIQSAWESFLGLKGSVSL